MVVEADRVIVTGEEAIRRCFMAWEDRWLSSSSDGSFECPSLIRFFPRDLMNDAVAVDDRFSEATEGMFIVWDLLGVEDEVEVILCELSMSVKTLDIDVDPLGGGSSRHMSDTAIGRA